MKKLLFLVAFCLILFAGVANAYTTMDFVEENGEYTLSLETTDEVAPEATTYIAVKNSNKELESVEVVPVVWNNNTFTKTGTISKNSTDTVDVYVWDKNMEPIKIVEPVTEQVLAQYCTYNDSSNSIQYVAETRKTYKLSDDAVFKVNGVEVASGTDFKNYLASINTHENIYLTDNDEDKLYDEASIRCLATMTVDEVIEKTSGEIKVITDMRSITLSDDTNYKIFKDGNEITASDLKAKDVLSIEYDLTGAFDESDFYNIYVSNATIEGMVEETGEMPNGWTYYTIGEKDYVWVSGIGGALTMLENYLIRLDIYGDIASAEVIFDASNYAIVDRYYTSAGETKVRLIHTDGTKADYALKADNTGLSWAMQANCLYPLLDGGQLITSTIGGSYGYNAQIKTTDRFVKYSVNSAGEVTLNSIWDVIAVEGATYSERTGRIGAYGISDETVIINAADYAVDSYKAVRVTDKSVLIDEMPYTAVFVGRRNTADGTYPLVYLLTCNSGYTTKSELMVATGRVKTKAIDGVVYDVVPVYSSDGLKKDLILSSNVFITGTAETSSFDRYYEVMAAIAEGVPFVAATNMDGEIEEILPLLSASAMSDNASMLANTASYSAIYSPDVNFVIAPVIKKYDDGIALATDMYSSYLSSDVGTFYSYSHNAKVYRYDGTLGGGFRLSKGESVADITQSVITNAGKINDITIDWTSPNNIPAFAVARLYNNDIQEIYSIVLDSIEDSDTEDDDATEDEVTDDITKYAIVDRYYTSMGDIKVRLIRADGIKVDYILKTDTTDLLNYMAVNTTYPLLDNGCIITTSDASQNMVATEKRFVEYTVNSEGEVTLAPTSKVAIAENGVYNERVGRIGAYGISDKTIIINAADYATNTNKAVKVINKSVLVDDMSYTAVIVGERNTTDGTYPLVYLLTGNSGYTIKSELVVAAGSVNTKTIDGTLYDIASVYTEDGKKELILSANVSVTGTTQTSAYDRYLEVKNAIAEGVPLVAAINMDGEIEEILPLLSTSAMSDNASMLSNTASYSAIYSPDVNFVIAPVIKNYADGIELATYLDGLYQSSDVGTFYQYSDDVSVYCCDGTIEAGYKFLGGVDVSAVVESVITNAGKSYDGIRIDWTSSNNIPAFAVARVYDGDIQEIYSIILE